MLTVENIAAMAIHILLPLAGLLWFIGICRSMYRSKLPEPPVIKLFFQFMSYGGLLQYFLVQILWQDWDFGLATLGIFYLVFIAPVLMLVFALDLRKRRHEGRIFRILYRASALYFIIAPFSIGLAITLAGLGNFGFSPTYVD